MRHDVFDFESELGWEGSNDKARAYLRCWALLVGRLLLPDWPFAQVMAIMKNSDYFVPPTQCNAAGVPQVRTGECVCAALFASALQVLNPASLQGGYLDMSAFIAEQGFKTGKGGYQKVRPNRTIVVVCRAAHRAWCICRTTLLSTSFARMAARCIHIAMLSTGASRMRLCRHQPCGARAALLLHCWRASRDVFSACVSQLQEGVFG